MSWLTRNGVVLALIFGVTAYALAEEVTITTYYPSPRGMYNELRTSGNVYIGDLGAPTARLQVIQPDPSTAPALRVNDQVGDTSPFIIEADGDVGIGTATPGAGARLHVLGQDDVASLVLFMPGIDTAALGTPNIQVGIGIATPGAGARLHVLGQNDVASTVLFMPGIDTAALGTPDLRVGIGAVPALGSRLHLQGQNDAPSTVLFMPGIDTAALGTPNIQVGIGTATPGAGARLHVLGQDDVASTVLFMPGADTAALGTPAIQVGIGTTSPAASSILELTSTTRGFLPPRMTTANRSAIASPATGVLIYNTTTNQYQFYNGTTWTALSSGGSVVQTTCSWVSTVPGSTGCTTLCPAGTTVVGGGISSTSFAFTSRPVTPLPGSSGWQCNTAGPSSDGTCYARCL